MQPEIVIRNGKVFDGERFADPLDIAISKDKIIEVGKIEEKGITEINAHGLIIAPGFVDVHTHATLKQMQENDGGNLISQGVTSIVTGNCGNSEEVRTREEVLGLIEAMAESQPAVNVATLVGHNSIRKIVLNQGDVNQKDINRPATAKETAEMADIVSDALKTGAIGFSSGLMYTPGYFAQEEEMITILNKVAKKGGIYTTHLRDEGNQLVESVEEAIRASKLSGVQLQLSHHKAVGYKNHGRVKKTLELIKEARKDGIKVNTDVYLYNATSTNMSILLSKKLLKEIKGKFARTFDKKEYQELQNKAGLQNLCQNGWKDVLVVKHENERYVGRTIAEIAINSEATQTYFQLLKEDSACRGVFLNIASITDIAEMLKQPFSMVASDGYLFDSKDQELVHPRSYGNVSTFLSQYIGEGKVSLEEGLRKLTSLPAETFSLKKRGRIQRGYFADLAIFDPENVSTASTYLKPCQLSHGMNHVICNGKIIFEQNNKQNKIVGGNGYFMTSNY